jgi:hypothetical protein
MINGAAQKAAFGGHKLQQKPGRKPKENILA